MGSFSPSDGDPLGGCDQQMLASPADDSMTSSPDGHMTMSSHCSLGQSMMRDLVTAAASMDETQMSNQSNGGGAQQAQMGNEMMFSAVSGGPAPQQQMIMSPAGAGVGGPHSVGGGGPVEEDKKFLSIVNNNNYMINSNAEYGQQQQQQHSPQLMGQLIGDYSNQSMVYGQQQQHPHHLQLASPCPPRDDIMPRGTPPSSAALSNDSNNHKITVKCAAELMQRGGAPEVGEGLRVHFKKKPEHRY